MRHNNRALIFLLVLFVSASCNQANNYNEKDQKADTQAIKRPANVTADTLDFLREFNGKYPNDVKLLDNLTLKLRLQKLLGNRYAFLKETWAVETPIEIKNNIFVASGCQTHNCSSTNFIIVVDLSKKVIYAGIREEEKVKLYAEDGSSNQELNNWAANN